MRRDVERVEQMRLRMIAFGVLSSKSGAPVSRREEPSVDGGPWSAASHAKAETTPQASGPRWGTGASVPQRDLTDKSPRSRFPRRGSGADSDARFLAAARPSPHHLQQRGTSRRDATNRPLLPRLEIINKTQCELLDLAWLCVCTFVMHLSLYW